MGPMTLIKKFASFEFEDLKTEVWGKKVAGAGTKVKLPVKIAIQFEKHNRKHTFIVADIVNIFHDGVSIQKTIPGDHSNEGSPKCLFTHNSGGSVRRQTMVIYAHGVKTGHVVRFKGYLAHFEREGVIIKASVRFIGNRDSISSALRGLK